MVVDGAWHDFFRGLLFFMFLILFLNEYRKPKTAKKNCIILRIKRKQNVKATF